MTWYSHTPPPTAQEDPCYTPPDQVSWHITFMFLMSTLHACKALLWRNCQPLLELSFFDLGLPLSSFHFPSHLAGSHSPPSSPCWEYEHCLHQSTGTVGLVPLSRSWISGSSQVVCYPKSNQQLALEPKGSEQSRGRRPSSSPILLILCFFCVFTLWRNFDVTWFQTSCSIFIDLLTIFV